MKPDDVSQSAWDAAKPFYMKYLDGPELTQTIIARAIMAEREVCAQHLENIAKESPLGHENLQRGKSTYNWLTHAASLIRNRP